MLSLLRAVAFVLAAGLLLAQAARAFDGETLRVASEGARPPYNFLDGNGDLVGFEIDLANAVCQKAGLICQFKTVEYDGLIPGLVSNHFDAIFAAFEISDERMAEIDFSKPYVRMPSAFLAARKRQIRDSSPAGLAGRMIGVEGNGPHQAWLEDRYKDSIIKTFGSLEDAALDLAEGRLDLALGDKDAVLNYLKTHKEAFCCKYLADVPRDPAFFGDGIGIGVRKDDGDLKRRLEAALDEVTADGKFAALSMKYFGFLVN